VTVALRHPSARTAASRSSTIACLNELNVGKVSLTGVDAPVAASASIELIRV